MICGSGLSGGCLKELTVAPSGNGGAGGSGAGGDMGGAGGAAGSPMICTPSSSKDCDTKMLGPCAPGTMTCNAEGTSYGACEPLQLPQFDNCRTAEDEDCDGKAITQCTGAIDWKYTEAGAPATPNDDILIGVAATPSGRFVVTGAVDGDILAGQAINVGVMYLGEVDAAGQSTWKKKIPGTGIAGGRAIAVDNAGNIIVVGDFSANITFGAKTLTTAGSKDAVIAKFNNVGEPLWVNQIGGTGLDVGLAVAVDTSGNIYAGGRLASPTIDLGAGPVTLDGDDAYLVSYAPDGTFRWGHVFVNPSAQGTRALTTTPDGDVIMSGESTGNLTFNGVSQVNGGGIDAFIAKFSGSTGNTLWAKASSTAADQFPRGVVVKPDGNVLLTGRFANKINFGGGSLVSVTSFDGFLVEFSGATGAVVRQMRAGQAGTTYAQAVAVDGAGDVLVHGSFEGITAWGLLNSNADDVVDVFTVKLDGTTWDPLWMKTVGGVGSQWGLDLAVAADGGIANIGYFEQEMNFGPTLGKVATTGGDDFYIMHLVP